MNIVLIFSGWINRVAVFNHNDLELACEWVSEQDWWVNAMDDIESFSTPLRASSFDNNLTSVSGDNGYLEVELRVHSEPLTFSI